MWKVQEEYQTPRQIEGDELLAMGALWVDTIGTVHLLANRLKTCCQKGLMSSTASGCISCLQQLLAISWQRVNALQA
jgi:hypothetical protein|eukprot:COSAG06_NODE_724_length_12795_cov_16.058129_12_plen_77_part_00